MNDRCQTTNRKNSRHSHAFADSHRRRGFTLIEILITLALIAIITVVAVVALNPGAQFSSARNTKRQTDLNAIMNAIRTNIADNRTGAFGVNCAAGDLPTSSMKMAVGAGNYDIAPCLIPGPIFFVMPYDPNASGAHFTSVTDYDSGYFVTRNATTGQVTLSAPSAELGKSTSTTLTR
ncbi:MAG: type II secretion system protein [bacterium]|nr:type II secretion system protein [bacterium]